MANSRQEGGFAYTWTTKEEDLNLGDWFAFQDLRCHGRVL